MQIFNRNSIDNYLCTVRSTCLPQMFVAWTKLVRPKFTNPKIGHKSRAAAVCGNKCERDSSRAFLLASSFYSPPFGTSRFVYFFPAACWQFSLIKYRPNESKRLVLLIEKRDADVIFLNSVWLSWTSASSYSKRFYSFLIKCICILLSNMRVQTFWKLFP